MQFHDNFYTVHELTIASASDKTHLQASSAVAVDPTDSLIDGETAANHPFETNSHLNRPWLQVTLPKEMWVKGAALHATTQNQQYLEVLHKFTAFHCTCTVQLL